MASSQTARTCSLRSSATASEVFMPERSLMYFFILETTMRTSRSKEDDSVGAAAPGIEDEDEDDEDEDEDGTGPDAGGDGAAMGETIRRGGLENAAPPGEETFAPPEPAEPAMRGRPSGCVGASERRAAGTAGSG